MLPFRKYLLKIWPYLSSITGGIIIYFVAFCFDDSRKDLFINISATLLAVPLLFLIYELAHNYSNKKLNKELFDYAKLQTDREMLSILKHLIKVVYPYGKEDSTTNGISAFLKHSKGSIKTILENEEYLGFQVFKKWIVIENNLDNILQNPFILKSLDNEQILALLNVVKHLRALDDINRNLDDLYLTTSLIDKRYAIKSGPQISRKNIEFPERLLLIRKMDGNKYQVLDYGDIPLYKKSKLLNKCKINPKYVNDFANVISELIDAINSWLSVTGFEFVVDTRMFKMSEPA